MIVALLEAADFLDAVALSVASGWGKGRLLDNGEPSCLYGHINELGPPYGPDFNARQLARYALLRAVAGSSDADEADPILLWNDAPQRTQDDVIELCHRVAWELRQRAQP